MRHETELVESLYAGTTLVLQAVRGEISMDEFRDQYANFYYVEALDGHEETAVGRVLLEKYRPVIEAHAAVQSVIDLTFTSSAEQRDQYLAAGRIEMSEAKSRLETIAAQYDLEGYFQRLSAQGRHAEH